VGIAPSAQLLSPAGEFGSKPLWGATLSVGGFLASEKPFWSNVLFAGEAGFLTGGFSKNILDYHDSAGEARIDQKTDLTSIPVFLSLTYNFQLNENIAFRAGPTLGATFISRKSKFSGAAREGDVWEYDSYSTSERRSFLSYGVALSGSWKFAENWNVDLQYRLTGNSALNSGESGASDSATSHQLNLGVRWNF
jgi:opacity protein-like surface antigen